MARSIKKKGIIYKGQNGTILNKMKPEQFYRNEILKTNYGDFTNENLKNKADYVIIINPDQLDYKLLEEVKKGDRQPIYYYHGDIPISESKVLDKPECIRSTKKTESRPVTGNVSGSSDITVKLRRDQCFDDRMNRKYQNENVTIYGFEWVEKGFEILRTHMKFPMTFQLVDKNGRSISLEMKDLSLETLQQIARNEGSNTSGHINFAFFPNLEPSTVYSLKDLVRQTVIVGKDRTTHYGGFKNSPRTQQNADVYICDLIALQFQQTFNSGRLVLVGPNLPKGVLDEFIYENVVGEKKATYQTALSDKTDRYCEYGELRFDKKAYIKFVEKDVLLSGLALDSSTNEKVNFKFVKHGCGFYADVFSSLINQLIPRGVADGLRKLLPRVKNIYSIYSIYSIFFERDDEIIEICQNHGIEIDFTNDDPLKQKFPHQIKGSKNRVGKRRLSIEGATAPTNPSDNLTSTDHAMSFQNDDGSIPRNNLADNSVFIGHDTKFQSFDGAIATTNCADNHASIGNAMGFQSIDGAIAENLSLKGFTLCPNINQRMKQVFLKM